MQMLGVQTDIRSVLREFYTCEVTTVNRQGQPITWPCAAVLKRELAIEPGLTTRKNYERLMRAED